MPELRDRPLRDDHRRRRRAGSVSGSLTAARSEERRLFDERRATRVPRARDAVVERHLPLARASASTCTPPRKTTAAT
jgi:hypothetical protein